MITPPDTDSGGPPTPALDIGPILAIHRDPGGYIGFCRKPDPNAAPRLDKKGKPYTCSLEHLFAIRASDLQSMFPALQEWLLHDSYFTVNASYAAAPYKNKQTGFPDVWRKEKYLRSLTACYADIDSGRPESSEPGAALSWREALHKAGVLADAGIIPQPSIMARSGRGVYLFWLLRDQENPDTLPRAWPDSTIPLYKAINKAIDDRLRRYSLPADLNATDAARVLRVPGSIHRKAGARVGYIIQADTSGKGFIYTLPELAQALDIKALTDTLPHETRALAKPVQYRKVKNPGTAPLRSHGTQALNALRASDLVKLQNHRGGFKKRGDTYPDGHTSPGRRFMLNLYLDFLHGSRLPQDKATEALQAMASNMIPAWPDDPSDPDIETIVADEYARNKWRRWKTETLLPLLGITDEIAEAHDLQTLIPATLRHRREAALPNQNDIIQARREWLREYILDHPGKWSCRRVVRLSALSPYDWNNQETANQDLNAIGHKAGHKVRAVGRPRKAV